MKKPADYHFEDLVKPYKLEDRIYRFRCVEAWSMVIPWQGIPLAEMIKTLRAVAEREVSSSSRRCCAPEQMPGQQQAILPWPYVEGLRMDEAMHPLTLMVTGLYGKTLPESERRAAAADHAVEVRLQGHQGDHADLVRRQAAAEHVADLDADEYGFYANVNPEVDHPRWTQASERRIGQFRRQKTLMFNGYADQVASLYAGMDLRKNF